MTELHAANTKGEKTFYEPVLSRITGKSQYRDTEYRLEGIDGYWNAGELPLAQAVIDGAVAWFTLASKPKSGPKAKPGSMYQDIVSIKPATPDDKASYNPSAPSPADYLPPEPATPSNGAHSAATGQPQNHWDVRDQQIKLGMAFNNLTTLLAGGCGLMDLSGFAETFGFASWEAAVGQWRQWFDQASQGQPLTPVQPEIEQQASELTGADPDASPLVEAAKAMGATEQQAEQAVAQDVQELNW